MSPVALTNRADDARPAELGRWVVFRVERRQPLYASSAIFLVHERVAHDEVSWKECSGGGRWDAFVCGRCSGFFCMRCLGGGSTLWERSTIREPLGNNFCSYSYSTFDSKTNPRRRRRRVRLTTHSAACALHWRASDDIPPRCWSFPSQDKFLLLVSAPHYSTTYFQVL